MLNLNKWVLSATAFFIYFVFIIGWSTFINRSHLFKEQNKTVTSFSRKQTQYTLNCFNGNNTITCPKNYHQQTFYDQQDQDYSSSSASSTCPEHFKWIHEDLKPWKITGITREMMESGKNVSHFRLVIVQGKVYLEMYYRSYQTRDLFTIWGILQLLRLYPGKMPDLELLFETEDNPVVHKHHFQARPPPPIFSYCGNRTALDIVFPDWSFWGWAEVGIRPWETTLQNIQDSSKKIKWKDREPYAYWKGNTDVSWKRYHILRMCNVSNQHDWNARIYRVHWDNETAQGFKTSKLEDQCTHRYKIYVDGKTWSVSEKYIMACDSMTLFVESDYYDFYTRGLVPFKHFWPISNQTMCQDIKNAVEWGNAHPDKAEAIGRAGTGFIKENLKMKFVYDYMFHLLTEYARFLRFEPTIPEEAIEICSENLACTRDALWREFMDESMVKSPSDTPPCTMSSPYDEDEGSEYDK